LSDTNTDFQGRLVYEPAAQGITVTPNTFQTFDTTNGRFYATRAPFNTTCSQANPCTRTQLLTAFPNVGIRTTTAADPNGSGILILRAGGPFAGGMVANADNLVVGVNGNQTTFDFEPDPPTVSIGDATVTEGDSGSTAANFVVTLSQATSSAPLFNLPVTVNYATANGSATAGSDYTATNGTLTFDFSQPDPNTDGDNNPLTQTVTVNVLGDTVFEGTTAETFTVNLSNANNALIDDGQGLGTINENETQPTLSIVSTTTGAEAGTVPNTFTVTLTRQTTSAVTVNYATADGTATAGSDYTATSGMLTFMANTTTLTQTITVPTLDDAVFESVTPENFTITLSGATNATIPMGSETATGTIADNDSTVQFDPDSYSVTEGGMVTITVSRTGITNNAVSVDYGVGTCNSNATVRCADGSDFTGGTGTLNFAAGDTSKTFTISANADINIESIETLKLILSNATGGAALGTPSTATVLISDGNISISGVVTRTVTGAGVGGVTLSLTGTNSATTITTTTAADGTYSFAGLQSGRNYLVTPTLAGNMFEPTERNYVNLMTNVTNANFVAFDGTANPRTLSVVDGFIAPGGPGFVTVNLNSQGNENALSFSLDFNDTNQLDVALNDPNDPNSGLAVTCGADAPSGCSVNASVDPTSGNLSVDLMLPSGQAFVGSPGCTNCNRRAVRIGFVNKNTAPTTPTFTIPVKFSDVPTFREVFGTGGNPLPARYIDGMISVRNLESDVGPRKTGDGRLTSFDQLKRQDSSLDSKRRMSRSTSSNAPILSRLERAATDG
jgi:hypothetical protein